MQVFKFQKANRKEYAIVAADNAKYALRKLNTMGFDFDLADCCQDREEIAVILELSVPQATEIYQVRNRFKNSEV